MQDSNLEKDNHIDQALRDWAEAGTLPPERSFQLERLVYQMSHQNRRNATVSVLRGTIAAIAAYITMLFLACPAAGSIIPAAEVLARHQAPPLSIAVEQVAYHPVLPAADIISISILKGARS
ncbi:MAG: hypothetical protein ACM3PE_11065 [Deltaproteobacteria bacterium]